MVRFTLLLFVALLGAAGRLAAQESVEMRGITSAVKLEEVVLGNLTEPTVSTNASHRSDLLQGLPRGCITIGPD